MPFTPAYGWPYQSLTDAPHGPNLGEDLALAIEATLQGQALASTVLANLAGRIPGERIATSTVSSDSATFTTTETVVASVTAPLVSGRTYRVTFDGRFQASASSTIRAGIREDTVSGTQIQLADIDVTTGGSAYPVHLEIEYTAASTANKTFVATGDRIAGTGNINLNAGGNFPAYLYVDYIKG